MKDLHQILAAGMLAVLAGTAVAKVERLAYFVNNPGVNAGQIVSWDDRRMTATLTKSTGVHEGTYTDDGVRRTLTLTLPISSTYFTPDIDACIGRQAQVREDLEKYVYKQVSGTSTNGVVEQVTLGTINYLDGCRAGQSEPIGSLDDPGLTLTALGMGKRPSMPAVLPGLRLAGFHEQPSSGLALDFLADADRTIVPVAGKLRFVRTGTEVAAAVDGDGWLKLSFPASGATPAYTRAYTKLSTDKQTGRQYWMEADFENGAPKWVNQVSVIPYKVNATFTTESAARIWLHSWAVPAWEWRLFPGGTGQIVDYREDPQLPPYISPINAWTVVNGNVEATRSVFSTFYRKRTWQPLNRVGDVQWMLETEVRVDTSTGVVTPSFGWRVVMWTDIGPGTPVSASTEVAMSGQKRLTPAATKAAAPTR